MTKAAFIKQDGGLFPADADGRELIASLKDNKPCMVKVHVPRNPRHHRLVFHMLNRVIESGAWQGDRDDLLDTLKLATRLVRTIRGIDGKTYIFPASISFEAMDQVTFNRWYERALYVICHEFLGREDWQCLRDEIGRLADGKYADERRPA